MFVGWLKPHELTRDTVITGMKPMCDHGDAYLIRNDANADEYYLLENRRKKGWDAHLPGEGLVVLHVDFDQETWLRNGVMPHLAISGAPSFRPITDSERYGVHKIAFLIRKLVTTVLLPLPCPLPKCLPRGRTKPTASISRY